MKDYIIIAAGCALVLSALYLFLAPEPWKQYTVCVFGFACVGSILTIMLVVSGSMKEDPHD